MSMIINSDVIEVLDSCGGDHGFAASALLEKWPISYISLDACGGKCSGRTSRNRKSQRSRLDIKLGWLLLLSMLRVSQLLLEMSLISLIRRTSFPSQNVVGLSSASVTTLEG